MHGTHHQGSPPQTAPAVGASSNTWARFEAATSSLDAPLAVLDVDALAANASELADRAAGKPIRLATKSVRSRDVMRTVLAGDGWHGVMSYSLPEAIWLHQGGVTDDILMGYPTTNRAGLATLAADECLANAITLMVDDEAQLDLIDAVVAPGRRPVLRVCLDLDASWRPMRGVHIGVRRSPLHAPDAVGRLARIVAHRPGFRLVGLMSYEAHIAGVADAPPDRPIFGRVLRTVQRRSFADIRARRGAAVAAAAEHADLEFVNGGGTGSLAASAHDASVTEVTAGSGLYGPRLFDDYRAWQPRPAAYFAMAVVRRPGPGLATVHGGGWIASGPAEMSRLPAPVFPPGLRLLPSEGAGEVQTPVSGPAADTLRVGDKVWFRHAKAGEVCEHIDLLHLVSGDRVVGKAPTYRGEHAPAFL